MLIVSLVFGYFHHLCFLTAQKKNCLSTFPFPPKHHQCTGCFVISCVHRICSLLVFLGLVCVLLVILQFLFCAHRTQVGGCRPSVPNQHPNLRLVRTDTSHTRFLISTSLLRQTLLAKCERTLVLPSNRLSFAISIRILFSVTDKVTLDKLNQ